MPGARLQDSCHRVSECRDGTFDSRGGRTPVHRGAVKFNFRSPAAPGGFLGLGLGLTFVTSFHTGLDFLAPVLVWPAFPCWWVARMSSPYCHEGIAWGLGVLALVALGALLGWGVGALFRRVHAGAMK